MKVEHSLRVLTLLATGMFWLLTSQPGFSYYNPSTGRWLSRDPLDESRGQHPYRFVRNNPAGAIDPDGRVTMSLDAKYTFDCGFSISYYSLTLDQPHNEPGYIIQEVSERLEIYKCDGQLGPGFFHHFWEILADTATNSVTVDYGDKSQTQPHLGTYGEFSLYTVTKWVPKRLTGDLKWGPYIPPENHGQPESDEAVTTRPDFWTEASQLDTGEKWGGRTLKAAWNCCCRPKTAVYQFDAN